MNKTPEKYPIITDKVITNPYEGMIIGNGDLAANVNIYSHEIVLSLAKNDIWDSRVDNIAEKQVLKHDDMLRYEKEYGFEWPEDCSKLPQTYAEWEGQPEDLEIVFGSFEMEREFAGKFCMDFSSVSPKKAGKIIISHPGLSTTKVNAKLDISNGLLEARFDLGEGSLIINAFVHKKKNIVVVKMTAEGTLSGVQVVLEKEPDYVDKDMPLPEVKLINDYYGTLSQTIPGKFDVDDFSWHLAAAFPSDAQGPFAGPLMKMAYAFRQSLSLQDSQSAVLVVGVATDRDKCANSKIRALKITGESSIDRYDKEFKSHTRHWEDFWSLSCIEMDDKELESVWYRNMYGFACHLKAGAQGPGLCANIPIADYSPWHGDYIWNHNVQKWYAPALSVNHLEWYEVLADLLNQSIPTFEHLAKTIFGLDGVYCDLNSVPYVPPHRTFINNKWGRALAMTGWLAYMLWQHWEFTHDNDWLKERSYTFIKKAARFYSNYLKKYQQEDGDIYPSMRLEEPGWCKGFVGNRNVVTDLVMFKKAFESAIKASEVLGVDIEERKEWESALSRVPEIEYGWTDDGQGWYALCKDWDKVDSVVDGRRLNDFADIDWRIQYARTARWGGGGWLVYPGEHIDGDENGGLAEVVRDMLRRVDIINPPNTVCKIHSISCLIPIIRLGVMEKYDDIKQLFLTHRFESGQFSPFSTGEGEMPLELIRNWRIVENQFQGILGISEMLLQSQGGIIRIFPFLPENIGAKFNELRAVGGFLVSAERKSGKGITEIRILSTAGEKCNIRWKEKEFPVIYEGNNTVKFDKAEQNIVFDTHKGKEYVIKPH